MLTCPSDQKANQSFFFLSPSKTNTNNRQQTPPRSPEDPKKTPKEDTMGSQDASRSLWVFGYGSLCWHPGFQHGASAVGHIEHYVRRFWQGNSTHRGIPGKVGEGFPFGVCLLLVFVYVFLKGGGVVCVFFLFLGRSVSIFCCCCC